MSTNNESKIKNLLDLHVPGTIILASWLDSNGFSYDLQQRYRKSGWLNSVGVGAFKRPWIDYGYVQSMKKIVLHYETYFEESKYPPLNFTPEIDWQFKKSEPYKHYFYVFYNQSKNLPVSQTDRIINVK